MTDAELAHLIATIAARCSPTEVKALQTIWLRMETAERRVTLAGPGRNVDE